MKKKVKFSYQETDIVFGNYDIMFPQTEHTKTHMVEFDGDAELRDYFSQFMKLLIDIGFNQTEILNQIHRYCDYRDEILPPSAPRV